MPACGQALEALGVDQQRVADIDAVPLAEAHDDSAGVDRVAKRDAGRLDRGVHAVASVLALLVTPQCVAQCVDRHDSAGIEQQAPEQDPALLAKRDRSRIRRKAHGHRTQNGVLDLGHARTIASSKALHGLRKPTRGVVPASSPASRMRH